MAAVLPPGVPAKVIAEASPGRYSVRVLDVKDAVVAERVMVQKGVGVFSGTEKAHVFEDALEEYPDLLEALEYGVDVEEAEKELRYIALAFGLGCDVCSFAEGHAPSCHVPKDEDEAKAKKVSRSKRA